MQYQYIVSPHTMFVGNKFKANTIDEFDKDAGLEVVGAPEFNNRYLYMINSADTTGINTAASWVDLPWNTENRKDDIYTHSTVTNNEQIEFNTAGDYEITVQLSTDVSSGGNRTVSEARLVRLDGTTDTFIAGTVGRMYNRSTTGGSSSTAISAIETMAANDVIKAQVRVLSGNNTLFVESDATRMKIKKV